MDKRIIYSTVGITYPDIYTSGNTNESETILGPFTKAIAEQFNEIDK